MSTSNSPRFAARCAPRRRAVSVMWWALAISSLTSVSAAAQNRSLNFDGVDQYLTVNDDAAFDLTSTLTVEGWFRLSVPPEGLLNALEPIVQKFGYPLNYYLRVEADSGLKLKFSVASGPNTFLVETTLPPIVGVWHHAAGVCDGQTVKLYLDGAMVASAAVSGALTPSNFPLYIGNNGGPGYFTGRLDEIRIWNVARSAGDIADGMGRSIQFAPGLVAAYRFDGSLENSASANQAAPVHAAIASFVAPTYSATVPPVTTTRLLSPKQVKLGRWCIWHVEAADVGAFYFFDVSFAAIGPGLPVSSLPAIVAPLHPPLLFLDFGPGLPTDWFADFVGNVPVDGDAYPRFLVPPLPSLAGLELHSSFVVFDPSTAAVLQISTLTETTLTSAGAEVHSIAPTSGGDVGGTAVTVTGTGFTASSTVRFDDQPAATAFVDATTLTAVSPPGTAGSAHVSVHTPSGFGAYLPDGYTYLPTLTVASATPPTAAAGVMVVVAGTAFDSSTSVVVGGIPVVPNVVAPTELRFVMPAGVACDAALFVANSDGQSVSFPINPSPVATFLFGAFGPAYGGGEFVVLGVFPPGISVTVGGQPAQIAASASDYLLAVAPAGASGAAAAVVVATSNGCTTSSGSYLYW